MVVGQARPAHERYGSRDVADIVVSSPKPTDGQVACGVHHGGLVTIEAQLPAVEFSAQLPASLGVAEDERSQPQAHDRARHGGL
jgi:hypothetical protein